MKKRIHGSGEGRQKKSIPVCINHAVSADGNYGYTEG